ncbi:hypothetical protein [Luteibacter sp. 9135]|uniref:hypothetical protein n=1 Tax=Luteibacter sp. 9135 TaxID=1500893 RepID=UPI00056A3101|nr:hypothetical protein [Luteibacter sp. 9135]
MVNHPRLAVALLLIAGTSWRPAEAGTVQFTQVDTSDAYDAGQRLIESFKFNLRGAQRYAATQTRLTTQADFDPFAAQWSRANVAQLKYQWRNATGQSRTTLYHALSGKAPPAAMGVGEAQGDAAYVMPDWQRYYRERNPSVYAHVVENEPSVLDAIEDFRLPGETAGVGHRFDAEMRGLRTLERDIVQNQLTPGGRVSMWTSSPPCPVCRRAMQIVADAYDLDIHVFHLPAPAQDSPQVFRLLQMTKNRMLRHFHQRVSNERTVPDAPQCVRS